MHVLRKCFLPVLMCLFLVILTSCAIFTQKGKSSKIEEKGRARIVNVEHEIASNVSEKLEAIAGLAYGTEYSLGKINDPPREVTVARDMNKRIVALAGTPTLEAMKEMQETIDKLTSMLALERDEGAKRMEEKDSQINLLQSRAKALEVAKNAEIQKYMVVAQEAAANADAYKSALDDYKGWFGLKAVGKGLWQFLKSSMWILGIGSILFIILRIASFSNPIAASIFSIFTTIASWVINIITTLVPKAVEAAGNTSNAIFNVYKSTLWKVVDGIQSVQDRAKSSGKTPDVNEVLDEVAKSMNSNEKAIVDEIKKSLNWK